MESAVASGCGPRTCGQKIFSAPPCTPSFGEAPQRRGRSGSRGRGGRHGVSLATTGLRACCGRPPRQIGCRGAAPALCIKATCSEKKENGGRKSLWGKGMKSGEAIFSERDPPFLKRHLNAEDAEGAEGAEDGMVFPSRRRAEQQQRHRTAKAPRTPRTAAGRCCPLTTDN